MNPTLRQTIQTKNLIVGLKDDFVYKVENISTDISLLSQPSELYKMLLPVIHLYSELSESLAMSLKEAIKKIFKEEMEKGEKGLLSSIPDSGKEEALYQALTYLRSTPFL